MMTLESFEEAAEAVSKVTQETKLVYSEYYSSQTGNKVYFKPENMQYTGAYKVRGAYYKISTLTEEQRKSMSDREVELWEEKAKEGLLRNDSNISSGLLVIDHDPYEWTQNYDENDYVIEGTFVVTINGKSYTANAGDCIFIPNGASVVMGSKDHCCKVFYNTYPSNWADLMEEN